MKRFIQIGLCLLAVLPVIAAAQTACASVAGRFVPSGDEVRDSKTGLVWARCSVGQTWGGATCTGTVSALTHESALSMAQNSTGWRLPNVKELAGLADKGCKSPAIDGAAFPDTPPVWYWSSTPNVTQGGSPWAVNFDNAVVAYFFGGSTAQARLVRIGP